MLDESWAPKSDDDVFRVRLPTVLIASKSDLDPEPAARRAIEDPVEQGEEVCGRVYARIEHCVTELARALGRPRSARVT